MHSRVTSTELPQGLPQLPGPKLAHFTPSAHADIEFIEELGNRAENTDSFVWKVRINGEGPCYALKVLWIDYFEPFSCECRVYGRLKEESREDLAGRAHGYLLLTPEQELEVGKRSKPENPNDEPDDGPFSRRDEPLFSDRPVHAIVKDLATDQNDFTAAHVEQMWNDVEDLHQLGILVRDITVGNYLGENDNDGNGADPRRYDWRKWESDLQAVDAFLEHDLLDPPYVIEPWVPTQDT